MDENKINFAWGGCGNLINHLLKCDQYFSVIKKYYKLINPKITWTNQEWAIRQSIGKNLQHGITGNINLAWENSLDTSFHYIIKNIAINHLDGPMIDRVKGVIEFNNETEQAIRSINGYYSLDCLLKDNNTLFDFCALLNPNLNQDNVNELFKLWKEKTQDYFELHSEQVLRYYQELGIDYSLKNLYNILYENTYTR